MFVSLQSGTIDLEEFIGGIALCLHGTVKDKCRILFHIFNLVCSVSVNKTGHRPNWPSYYFAWVI